jgi:UDPglucose--hexose-1-phosphate uridylyltransferase
MTERRFDPVTGEWRVLAAFRQDRTYLPEAAHCPLCPTTDPARPTEIARPEFQIAVFDNRFPALMAKPAAPSVPSSELYSVEPAAGAAEVVVYTQRHEASLGDLPVRHLARLVDVWADRYTALSTRDEVGYVFIFENRGRAVGVTLDHPHGQIYGYPDIPPLPQRELDAARAHQAIRGTCVLCDVLASERADGVRVVAHNDAFLAFVPFAARMPYEVHLVAQRHATSLADLTDPERIALAEILRRLVAGYDALFDRQLPYVMSMHQAPTREERWLDISHLHIEFTPVHRTETRLKYLAGSELGAGMFIGDVLPEQAAAALRRAHARAAAGERQSGPPALSEPVAR